ncbi:imelysin, partial [Pseudomonas syringae]
GRSKWWRSSREACQQGAGTVWPGGDNKGWGSLLPAGKKPLADNSDAAYDNSRRWLSELKPPLADRLATDAGRQQRSAFYDSLNAVHRLHEGERAKALGIQVGFNANDGD